MISIFTHQDDLLKGGIMFFQAHSSILKTQLSNFSPVSIVKSRSVQFVWLKLEMETYLAKDEPRRNACRHACGEGAYVTFSSKETAECIKNKCDFASQSI